MKAIILAAGEWTRLRPLTYEIPKAMVEVWGKSLLEHNMDKLLWYVNEFIIVVKYKKEKVEEKIRNIYKWIPVQYHVQNEEKWTWAAIKWVKIKGDIIIAYADAIISQIDVDNVMQATWFAVLWKKVQNPEKYGIFKIKNWYITEVIEKPKEYVGNMANFWFFKVNDTLLDIVETVKLSPRGEIEITDAINIFVKNERMQCIELQNDIIDITSLEDLEEANKIK
jgi:dTDP-glucose pyrophosphorylase